MSLVYGAGLLISLASLAGLLFFGRRQQQFMEKNAAYLVSFSAGVLLVTSGGLALEVFEVAVSFWQAAIVLVAGYMLALLIEYIIPESHHHHADSCHHKPLPVYRLLIGESFHHIGDGIVLVSAFAVSPLLGATATISIFVHEIVKSTSEFFVMTSRGVSRFYAIVRSLLVGMTVLIGIAIGQFTLLTERGELLLLALSAGFFFHVVLHDLLPQPHQHDTKRAFFFHLAVACGGVAVMIALRTLVGAA